MAGMAKKKSVFAETIAEQPVAEVMEPGTIVRLRSGGPKMTVKIQETPDAEVWCLWFAGKKLETGCFGVQTLSVAGEGKKKKTAK
jgi:uncharacterized protein YodC (DUF2158 family)